ncbi:hypothetical protein [Maribacter sp.]|uniref:hypothetical protein n=1 Tax=Maribacter sp. TaxID=1897614 RepID=UPI0025B946BB|nr:hypothetical protein [Maribacter sp.]
MINNRLFKIGISIVLLFVGVSCKTTTKEKEDITHQAEKKADFKYWTWITASEEMTDSAYRADFKKYKANGIDAVLINTYADAQVLTKIVPFAKEENLEVHAWMFTVNRPGDKIAEQHPEWYQVSRDGKSCYDEPPYVTYYKWLCPTREDSRSHILSLVEGLAKVEGVASVHLDYIRYSDIFLPIGLLPKYDLVQNTELPRFDFCYCDTCVAEFEKLHHKNPRDSKDPAIDMEWKNFRLNKVKSIVNEAYTIAHDNGKLLTAAVFPYPEMADHMVRQRWDKWNVDAVLPMIYNNFYNEEIDWIGYATKQGVADLKGKNTALHTGVYVPPMTPEELGLAIKMAKDNGAAGISFFDGGAITPEQLAVIKASKN